MEFGDLLSGKCAAAPEDVPYLSAIRQLPRNEQVIVGQAWDVGQLSQLLDSASKDGHIES